MVDIVADRRRIQAAPDPEGERLAAAATADRLDASLRLARLLRRLDRAGTHHLHGCSSVVHYAMTRLGLPAAEARTLLDLGRALEAEPEAEERVRSGALPVEHAALVGRLYAEPGRIEPGEDWFRRAEALPRYDLRRWVFDRMERASRRGDPVHRITLQATNRTRSDFSRAQALASRAASMLMTEGQTFAAVLTHYLDHADETRRSAAAKRPGPAGPGRAQRHIPAEARRAVVARSGDRCEVPGCTFGTFLEFAHVEAHAQGGSREPENLLRLCSVHHVHLDADHIRYAGVRDGRPVFRDPWGDEIGAR